MGEVWWLVVTVAVIVGLVVVLVIGAWRLPAALPFRHALKRSLIGFTLSG